MYRERKHKTIVKEAELIKKLKFNLTRFEIMRNAARVIICDSSHYLFHTPSQRD